MDSTIVKHELQSLCHIPGEKEISIDRLQQQFHELEKGVDKDFDDVDNVEGL